MTLRATVLIPAHDEASVITRTLRPLRAAAEAGVLKLVVIANGCADATAKVAASACPSAVVLETAIPGKTQALNLGFGTEAVAGLPVLCLDADLEVSEAGLLALVRAVEQGALAAVGRMTVDATKASPLVRAYQRAWALNPYFAKGKFGGVFALAHPVARQVFPLPAVTGDDEFLRRSLDPARVAFVPECQFVAQSPRTLASLHATRKRALRGARQVQRLGLANPTPSSATQMLRAGLAAPRRLGDLVVFFAVVGMTRLSLALEPKGKPQIWERDLTTREGRAQ